jgi:dTDP-4-dehydrorhamnose 3,5-epimerase
MSRLSKIKNLQMNLDDRGYLFEVLRNDDAVFTKFGQAYVSSIYPGVVKGFHKHFVQYDNVCCISGQIKLVLIKCGTTNLVDYEVEEHHLSIVSPKLIIIPPNIYHGWMCIGTEPALVLNISSEVFDRNNPDEERIDPHLNPWGYKWEVKDK